MEYKNREIAPENRRDTTSDKKKIKKIAIIILCVFVSLGLLLGVLALVTELLKDDCDDISYEDFRFFEADYNKNVLEDELYLSKNRDIYYNRFGTETILTESNVDDISLSARFFYDYFNCVINGDYQTYPEFFTKNCLESEGFSLPEKFTMQGLYNIHVDLYTAEAKEVDGVEVISEIYEVSYRIFENNGTFRSDVLPDETRTLVFELYIYGGTVKINAIGHRTNG
ncbi:MAG: hypothetical protein J6Q89_00415 [Clostridia bacterium]|nr:hypothetical protein [Clostridia bacterium]